MVKRMRPVTHVSARWRRAALVTLLSAAVPASGSGQDFDREVAFLTIPTGARAVGMGRAAATFAGDPQGVRWNPAVLAVLRDVAPLVSSYDGPLEFGVNQLAVGLPVSSLGVFYLSAEAQSFGDIPLTTSDSPDESVASVTPSNLILAVGFARPLLQRLSLGVSAKWIRSELLGDMTGSTLALDAGLLWVPLRRVPLRIGVSATNLGPDLKIDGGSDAMGSPLPGRLRYGASYDVVGQLRPGGDLELLVAFDMEHALRDLATASQYFGLELGVLKLLYLRGGLVFETLIETNTGSTLGVGLRFGAFGFDLARELGVNQLGDETHLSMSARL